MDFQIKAALNQSWQRKIACFLSAQTISLLGSSLVQYAIIWQITLTTSSGKLLTLATLCGFLPQLLISLFAGVWLDRFSRKRLMIWSDGVIALATLLLALAFIAGQGSITLLLLVLAIRSVGTGIQTPAVSAVLPQLVPKAQLMRINGIQSTLSSMTMFLSPALSGALLAVAPLQTVLLVDVVTAIIGISITAQIAIPVVQHTTAAGNTVLADLRAGLSYLKEHDLLRQLLRFQVVILIFISPSAFLTPLLVSRTFGPEVWRLSLGEMTYSLGMILGGLLITTWGGFPNRLKTTLLAAAFYGLLMLGMGTAPVFFLYLVCNGLIGVTAPCYNAPITVVLQEQVAPDMLGRVFSLLQITTSCALPLGMALFGPLADILPVQYLLLVNGVLVLAVTLVVSKKITGLQPGSA